MPVCRQGRANDPRGAIVRVGEERGPHVNVQSPVAIDVAQNTKVCAKGVRAGDLRQLWVGVLPQLSTVRNSTVSGQMQHPDSALFARAG